MATESVSKIDFKNVEGVMDGTWWRIDGVRLGTEVWATEIDDSTPRGVRIIPGRTRRDWFEVVVSNYSFGAAGQFHSSQHGSIEEAVAEIVDRAASNEEADLPDAPRAEIEAAFVKAARELLDE